MVKQGTLLSAAAVLLGGLIAFRLFDGTAGFLVQDWYLPVLVASAAVLLGLAALSIAFGEKHGEASNRRLSSAGLLTGVLVAIPLALGAAFKPEPLGTDSLGEDALASRQFSASAASSDASLRNIYQWAYEFQTAQPAEIAGSPVEVIGFVYHKEADTGERFHIARFVVACCVADAQGFALPVQWKDASTLEDDRWVRLTGRVTTGPDGAPLIQAQEIEEIEAPSNPYIYP